MEHMRTIFDAIKRLWKKAHMTQVVILVGLSTVLFFLLYFGYHAITANVQSLKQGLTQSTVIYDKNGEVATEISANRGESLTVSEIPLHVQQAVIAIEDHRFYEHRGFDVKGITRAFFKNIFAGRVTGGGSTITQQLTKNALLSPEKTYKRKVEELFLAVEIEKHYSKNEILQMYLNQVYFGNGAWGIERAANRYFSKRVSELTISESALLAGLLKAPSGLDPTKYYDRAIERRNVVLAQMKEFGYLSDKAYEQAVREKIQIKLGQGNFVRGEYPYYVDAVLDEAIQTYGLSQEEIFTRGYQIYTEMDRQIQTGLERVYSQTHLFPKGRGEQIVQSGAVLLDPASGGVRGLVGGRGEHVFRGFNRATHLKAQPGSTLKPLAVYTPALEEGYTSQSVLVDKEMAFGSYKPENYTKTYSGEVPLYRAVEESLNVPTVWLLNEMGLDKGLNALKRFGIPLEKEDEYLGIGLGGMHKGISPLRLAEAYATFPNEGKRPKAHFVTEIIGPTGQVIAEFKPKNVKVTSPQVANEMTAILLNVVETGTGKGTQINNIPLAGKTGSTQLPYGDINGTKDQWFVGYTKNIVGAVWLGYDHTDREHYLTGRSSDYVIPIFKTMMEQALPHTAQEPFQTVSVNAQLRGATYVQEKSPLKQQTEKIKEKITEEMESGRWKDKIVEGLEALEELGQIVKEKISEWTH